MDQFTLGLAAGALLIILAAASALISSWKHARHAAELGCKIPYRRRDKLPFAIDFLWSMAEADRQHRAPQQGLKLYQETGHATFKHRVLGADSVITADPKNLQALLALQFYDFGLGSRRRDSFFPLLGNGIFTSDGKDWEHSRAMLRPQFSRNQISDLELEEGHVKNMFLHLKVDKASGWTDPMDLSPVFFRLTMDSATEFLFGESLESQVTCLEETLGGGKWNSVAASFDRATAALGIRARMEGLFWLYNPKSFRDDCKEVHKFADYCINAALERRRLGTKKTHGKYIFLEELLDATSDLTEIRSQLLNILLAGRDTTAGLLGWTFWCLARHPEVFAKLRASILEHFGEGDDSDSSSSQEGSGGAAITFSGLKSCTYLQHVLAETLRLYPSVPFNERQATRDTTLPRGGGPDESAPIYIRKNQPVCYSAYIMHRRKELWGDDADDFRPERWVGRKSGWEYLPFNGGPRVCLGQQFALTEAAYVVTRILQRFDMIRATDDCDEPLHQYSLTSAPKNVFVSLHQAGMD